MSRPNPPITTKDDDDSWGKLASDLLGVSLNVDADFDFPESEPLVPPPATQSPVAVVEAPLPPTQAPATQPMTTDDDLSWMDFDSDEPEVPPVSSKPVMERAPAAPQPPREEAVGTPAEAAAAPTEPQPKDEYWGALEEWDWSESGTKKPRARSAEDSGDRRGDRPRRGGGDRPRRAERGSERPPREDASTESRSRRTESRGDEPVAAPPRENENIRSRDAEVRDERGPRRERSEGARPRRESSRPETPEAPRRRERAEEPAAGETPARRPVSEGRREQSDRPPRRSEGKRAEQPTAPAPSRPRPPQEKRRPKSEDAFGEGLDENSLIAADEWAEDDFVEESFTVPVAAVEADDAEFEVDRPQPVARRQDDDEDIAEDVDGVTEGDGGEEDDRPRRRRRRRRRSRGPRDSAGVVAGVELPEDTLSDEDLPPVSATPEEAAVDEEETDDDDEAARPRRRRRRGRRRPAEAGVDTPRPVSSRRGRPAEDELSEGEAEDVEVRPSPPERPRVQRASYDDIPTWEEAISYLHKPTVPQGRGRSDDRRGPPRQGRRGPGEYRHDD